MDCATGVHVTRNGSDRFKEKKHMQNRDEMLHCKIVLFSISYSVYNIVWVWRDFKYRPKLPPLTEYYKSGDEE